MFVVVVVDSAVNVLVVPPLRSLRYVRRHERRHIYICSIQCTYVNT